MFRNDGEKREASKRETDVNGKIKLVVSEKGLREGNWSKSGKFGGGVLEILCVSEILGLPIPKKVILFSLLRSKHNHHKKQIAFDI